MLFENSLIISPNLPLGVRQGEGALVAYLRKPLKWYIRQEGHTKLDEVSFSPGIFLQTDLSVKLSVINNQALDYKIKILLNLKQFLPNQFTNIYQHIKFGYTKVYKNIYLKINYIHLHSLSMI